MDLRRYLISTPENDCVFHQAVPNIPARHWDPKPKFRRPDLHHSAASVVGLTITIFWSMIGWPQFTIVMGVALAWRSWNNKVTFQGFSVNGECPRFSWTLAAGDKQGALRHAKTGVESSFSEAAPLKGAREAFQRLRANRFGSAKRQSPGTQVQSLPSVRE